MTIKLPKLIATSVVRGSQQGESHGGIYTVDFGQQDVVQHVDWNNTEINFAGRGADRGLRGIAISEGNILVAASDELFCFDRDFEVLCSFKNRYLKHCHEICRMKNTLFLASTGFDSLLAFDLDKNEYNWGFHLLRQYDKWTGHTFDPGSGMGPKPVNDYHVNMVHVDESGIYFSGLHTNALLHLNSNMEVTEFCSLPAGTHNARPFSDGLLFNDTQNDCVRYASRNGDEQAYKIVTYDEGELEFADKDHSGIARQGFGRGLCSAGECFVAGGSSPSTISLYDLKTRQIVGSVNLSMDIRNAIHGLEVWPFD